MQLDMRPASSPMVISPLSTISGPSPGLWATTAMDPTVSGNSGFSLNDQSAVYNALMSFMVEAAHSH